MRNRAVALFFAALIAITGCNVYYPLNPAQTEAQSTDINAQDVVRSRCVLRTEVASNPWTLGDLDAEKMQSRQKAEMLLMAQNSGWFSESACNRDVDFAKFNQDQIKIDLLCKMRREGDPWAMLGIFTLGIFSYYEDFVFDFEFYVEFGRMRRQYMFEETIRKRWGWVALFASPFMEGANEKDTFGAMNRKVMNNLFVKMQQDGFFSAEGRDKAASAKTDVVEAAKKTVAARRKELEDLKKAGIITEVEYAAEVKKLEGAGK